MNWFQFIYCALTQTKLIIWRLNKIFDKSWRTFHINPIFSSNFKLLLVASPYFFKLLQLATFKPLYHLHSAVVRLSSLSPSSPAPPAWTYQLVSFLGEFLYSILQKLWIFQQLITRCQTKMDLTSQKSSVEKPVTYSKTFRTCPTTFLTSLYVLSLYPYHGYVSLFSSWWCIFILVYNFCFFGVVCRLILIRCKTILLIQLSSKF